jgi:hypothetical protein
MALRLEIGHALAGFQQEIPDALAGLPRFDVWLLRRRRRRLGRSWLQTQPPAGLDIGKYKGHFIRKLDHNAGIAQYGFEGIGRQSGGRRSAHLGLVTHGIGYQAYPACFLNPRAPLPRAMSCLVRPRKAGTTWRTSMPEKRATVVTAFMYS